MLYPLIDVFIYSFEENFKFTTQTYTGIGFENYIYIFKDYKFLDAIKNTFLIVIITVPLSTIIALMIAVALNAIKPLKAVFQTVFFLPYVTNALAVGLVFMIIFDMTPDTIGVVNSVLGWFGIDPIDWLNGAYWSKMFVLCTYIIWNVMPFKILVLIGALQSVKKEVYDAAKVDAASKTRRFFKITVPMISPMLSYLIITGFIGAFKEYNNAVGIFGSNLNLAGMNTIVGCVYDYLYSVTGGYPSRAAAAAIVLFAIIMSITAVNLFVSKKKVHY
jgi:multiple sugar transport system permease protein